MKSSKRPTQIAQYETVADLMVALNCFRRFCSARPDGKVFPIHWYLLLVWHIFER